MPVHRQTPHLKLQPDRLLALTPTENPPHQSWQPTVSMCLFHFAEQLGVLALLRLSK